MAFIDQGEFEAMKTLSSWEAARCDEHPFCAKIKVVLEPFLSYHCLNRVVTKTTKNGTFAIVHICV